MADTLNFLPLNDESIQIAHTRIAPYIRKTPLITNDYLDQVASSAEPRKCLDQDDATLAFQLINGDAHETNELPLSTRTPKFRLYFKAENFQHIGAFKARGAFFSILHLIDELGHDALKRRGVITHSSGNHAQALSMAAWTFGVPAYIVMPRAATKSKIAGARRYATKIVFSESSTSVDREATMKALQEATNAIFVPPFDYPDVILGQGTIGKEMSQQFDEFIVASDIKNENQDPSALDGVVAPLGGGGLLAGVATWFSGTSNTQVFGVEPSFQGADDGRQGRRQGGVRIDNVDSMTIADGLRMPVGHLNWNIVSDPEKVSNIYSVSEEEIKMAMRLVFEHLKVVAEPSACLPLAAVLFNEEFRALAAEQQKKAGRLSWHIGIVLSGGNTTMEKIAELFGPHT